MKYTDRQDAGRALAQALESYIGQPNLIVLALPRGGVPVAYEVATQLKAPLDVYIVRKLGVPTHDELAMGALASGGVVLWNDALIQSMGITEAEKKRVLAAEQQELTRREEKYRGKKPFPNLAGKTVILVDDGIATGFTMQAAIAGLRQKQPKRIIVAAPVGARETCETIAALVDALVCPLSVDDFYAVGFWYEQFTQTTDAEVMQCLAKF